MTNTLEILRESSIAYNWLWILQSAIWMCPPKFICWKLNPQWVSVKRWGLTESLYIVQGALYSCMN